MSKKREIKYCIFRGKQGKFSYHGTTTELPCNLVLIRVTIYSFSVSVR